VGRRRWQLTSFFALMGFDIFRGSFDIAPTCQKLGAVGLTALGRAQLCPAVAGGSLLRLSLPGPHYSLRAICPCGARLANVSAVGVAPWSTQAFTAR
jgi:hypothetical protein